MCCNGHSQLSNDGANALNPSQTTVANLDEFSASVLDKEILLRVPRPRNITNEAPTVPLWSLAGKKMGIVVLPCHGETKVGSDTIAIKVIYGTLVNINRKIAPPPKVAQSCFVEPGSTVVAGTDGAVFITIGKIEHEFQGPFSSMHLVKSQNSLPITPSIPPEAAKMTFPFIKVEKLSWGMEKGLWNDFEFYNAVGFHVYFNDDALQKVCHIQAWTLGIGETARFHNHSDLSFCEIHLCLTNGGGSAGMRYFPDNFPEQPPVDTDKELTKDYVQKNSKLIVVGDLDEHGPLWKIQSDTVWTPKIRQNDTVDYPWHAWLASKFGDYAIPIKPSLAEEEQRFDVWLAFEFPSSAFQE